MASVRFDGVTKYYPDGTMAVAGLDFGIEDGEFAVLVGPSGCGKTTALRMVAGLEEITDGTISIGDQVINDLEPHRRDIAMVFQNYALYPNMSVADNMAFGLRMRGVSRGARTRKVEEIAAVLGLSELLHRRPGALSGGQRQRVAMGRAIVRDPQVFLMDEPLSNLDAKLRVQMRGEIARIQRELGTTTIYVTHDQVEAMTMGTRVAVMRKGLLQQHDDPRTIYDAPANLFVASFIGSPPMNLLEAIVEITGEQVLLRVGEQALKLNDAPSPTVSRLRRYSGSRIVLGIRPESLTEKGVPARAALRGRVIQTEQLGSEMLVHVELPVRPLTKTEIPQLVEDIEDPSSDFTLGHAEKSTTVLARFGPRANPLVGEDIDLSIDPDGLHFFDAETAEAIATTIPQSGTTASLDLVF